MKAVILAGGAGTRLRPVTERCPKPLVKVGNRPVLGLILEHLASCGVEEAVLTLRVGGQRIRDWCEAFEGPRPRLSYFFEDVPLGTAGSVAACAGLLDGGDFFVLAGDVVSSFDLRAAAGFHAKHAADATLLLCRAESPLEYGVCVTDPQGRIEAFVEKPSWERVCSDRINTGIYIMKRACLDRVPRGVPCDFGRDLFPALLKDGARLYGCECDGYWCDVGGVEAYLGCNAAWLDGRIRPDRALTDEIDGVKVIPPVAVGARLAVGAGSVIGPHVVLGDDVTLGENSRLSGCVVGDGVRAGSLTQITGAVVCAGGVLGDGCRVGEGAALGEGCTVPDGVEVPPRARIAASGRAQGRSDGDDGMLFDERGFLTRPCDVQSAVATGGALAAAYERIALGWEDARAFCTAQAFCAGALAAGADVTAAGECTPGALRFYTVFSGAAAGLYVGSRGGQTYARLYDGAGLVALPSDERAVCLALKSPGVKENATAGEYRFDAYGGRMLDVYCAGLAGDLSGLTLLPDGQPGQAAAAARVFAQAGARIAGGGIRVVFDDDGDGLSMSCGGRDFSRQRLRALLWSLADGQGACAPDAPVWALRRAGIDARRAPDERGSYRARPWCTDALAGACRILSIIAAENTTLAALTDALPDFCTVGAEIDLSAGRAHMMDRVAALDAGARETGLGCAFTDDRGEVLIHACKTREALSVLATAADAETAAELCGEFCDRIEKIHAALDNN